MKLLLLILLISAVVAQKGLPVKQKISEGRSPQLSEAMRAVLIMTIVFFITEVAAFFIKASSEMRKIRYDFNEGQRTPRSLDAVRSFHQYMGNIRDYLWSSDLVTRQIPVLCVLILFARFRTMVSLEGTETQEYAQGAFMAISILVCIQGASLFLDTCENATLKVVNLGIQGVCKLSIMICVIVVIESIFSTKKLLPTTT